MTELNYVMGSRVMLISKIVLVVYRKLIPRKLTSDGAEETSSDLLERFRQS